MSLETNRCGAETNRCGAETNRYETWRLAIFMFGQDLQVQFDCCANTSVSCG